MKRPISPAKLLEQADRLAKRAPVGAGVAGQPRNIDLRRAVSAAYYALFHDIVSRIAGHLLPAATDAERWAIGRGLTHGNIKAVCLWVQTPGQAGAQAKDAMKALALNPDVLDVAIAFTALQELRHDADYDHSADFTKAGTLAAIDQARDAIDKLHQLANAGIPDYASLLVHFAMKPTLK